ncbi:MAG: hypothetical protein A2066_20285 [Bacteroidetes bacterium GWB2_41_8]|nr:MAG: hypothetical protein A2066_20285 [Bacteroidetes bacterium GWB2_41_8]
MKKYIIPFILLFASLISCDVNDTLDIPQKGVLSTDLYKTATDEQTLGFIAAIHAKIRGKYYEDRILGSTACAFSIRANLDQMSGDFAQYYSFTETAGGSTYKKMWSYYYTNIYWCNMIIINLPENTVASQEVKDRAVAEARVIRAIMMMQLVQLWGNPPLADHIMDGTEGNTPAATSWAFIEKELNEAALSLPSKNGPDGQVAFGSRLTKEAAYAYLGKAYLWEGKYSDAASTLYSKVIATNLYSLVADYTKLNSYTSDLSAEYIWECNIQNDPAIALSQAGLMDAVLNWAPASLNIPDGYYDGVGWNDVAYASESFGVFMENHEQLTNGKKTARYRGTLASYEELIDPTLFTYSNGNKGSKTGGSGYCEGYFRLKLIPRKENIMGGTSWPTQFMHNNLPYMRYSEVLLNYAEAVAKGGNSGAISGLEALNIVRRRAGLQDASALDMNNEQYGVKAERRAELFFEGTRFIDLVRWKDFDKLSGVNNSYSPMFYGYVDGNNGTQQSKANWKIVKNPILAERFKTGKNELFPIPTSDINANPNLVQNPGW